MVPMAVYPDRKMARCCGRGRRCKVTCIGVAACLHSIMSTGTFLPDLIGPMPTLHMPTWGWLRLPIFPPRINKVPQITELDGVTSYDKAAELDWLKISKLIQHAESNTVANGELVSPGDSLGGSPEDSLGDSPEDSLGNSPDDSLRDSESSKYDSAATDVEYDENDHLEQINRMSVASTQPSSTSIELFTFPRDSERKEQLPNSTAEKNAPKAVKTTRPRKKTKKKKASTLDAKTSKQLAVPSQEQSLPKPVAGGAWRIFLERSSFRIKKKPQEQFMRAASQAWKKLSSAARRKYDLEYQERQQAYLQAMADYFASKDGVEQFAPSDF